MTHGLRALEGQARRALGLALRDPAPLDQALQTFETIGALPCAARARCELAVLTGDAGEFARGVQVLERLGDLDRLERLERTRQA